MMMGLFFLHDPGQHRLINRMDAIHWNPEIRAVKMTSTSKCVHST
jgi:hypothetical protein